jgi:hypothetical protein
VGTPLGANERLIEGRALKELMKVNILTIIINHNHAWQTHSNAECIVSFIMLREGCPRNQ